MYILPTVKLNKNVDKKVSVVLFIRYMVRSKCQGNFSSLFLYLYALLTLPRGQTIFCYLSDKSGKSKGTKTLNPIPATTTYLEEDRLIE